jgi:enamine deaminase RidA (YjgF/YER057c/UK114 family)
VSKKIISIILLLSFVDFVNAGEIEHFSSEDALKKNYPFSEAVRVDDVLYISGMVAEGDDGQVIKGHLVLKNMGKILAHFNLTYSDVFKCLVMIDDIEQWSDFNSVYIQYFEKPYPARSAFGADGLALEASLELECLAYFKD